MAKSNEKVTQPHWTKAGTVSAILKLAPCLFPLLRRCDFSGFVDTTTTESVFEMYQEMAKTGLPPMAVDAAILVI